MGRTKRYIVLHHKRSEEREESRGYRMPRKEEHEFCHEKREEDHDWDKGRKRAAAGWSSEEMSIFAKFNPESSFGENAKEFTRYVMKNGLHFNEALAKWASEQMENVDGSEHRWTSGKVEEAMTRLGIKVRSGVTAGDTMYVANMMYADYAKKVDEVTCLNLAAAFLNDPDGYPEKAFCEWIVGAMMKRKDIPWNKV